MTNYPDIICKYLTYYKDTHVEVVNEPVYNLPILRVFDDRMGTQFTIYKVSQITQVFRDLGALRKAYGTL